DRSFLSPVTLSCAFLSRLPRPQALCGGSGGLGGGWVFSLFQRRCPCPCGRDCGTRDIPAWPPLPTPEWGSPPTTSGKDASGRKGAHGNLTGWGGRDRCPLRPSTPAPRPSWLRLDPAVRGARLPSRGSPGTNRRAPWESAPLAPALRSDPGQPLAACSGPLGEPRADPGVSTWWAATMIPRGKRRGGRSCGSSPRMGRGEHAEMSFPAAAPQLKRGFGFWFFFVATVLLRYYSPAI
ncbi:uncharacterized protein, partial [Symphalangus syndactylus]|uniref:uncharacterized protein n=1 Tax=Symphalangus syndactylus TaxID=9590 RepID=UPI00244309E7